MFLIIHVDNIKVVFYPQNTKFKKLCLNSMIHFSINIQDKSFVQYVHSSIIKEYCKKQLLGITSKMEKNLLSNITEKYKIIYDTDYEEDEDDFIETSTNKKTTCVHNKSLMSLDDAEKLIRYSNNINKEQ